MEEKRTWFGVSKLDSGFYGDDQFGYECILVYCIPTYS